MITKYSIDLRQFNNGEGEKITFPTFEQCLMYGMHKLKQALNNKRAVVKAILIEAPHERKIVVTPSNQELESLTPVTHPPKFKIRYDQKDSTTGFLF
tara:strand:- start:288 stop:578 length:291 start_codon:yes stop_codon:yes gene_type:complete